MLLRIKSLQLFSICAACSSVVGSNKLTNQCKFVPAKKKKRKKKKLTES